MTTTVTQHTPGPWTAVNAVTPEGHDRWYVWGPDRTDLSGEADARLIAAAPEMLAIIRNIAGGYATARDMSAARALLAKIEGGQ